MKFTPYREFFFWTILLVIITVIFLVGCFSSLGKTQVNRSITKTSESRLTKS